MTWDHGRELIAIYLAFIWIIWRSVRKASDVRWTMIGDLAERLEGAELYLAIGTIPLREWFEPNTLVYLATIVAHQLKCRHHDSPERFRHSRVLLFYKDSDFEAIQASYLDQHYAKSFSAIHDRFQIPLAYLKPKELGKILKALGRDDRWELCSYRWFAKPESFWRNHGSLKKFAKDTTKLRPFTWIKNTDSTRDVMLRFSKDGNVLTVEPIEDKAELAACERFITAVQNAIYKDKHNIELHEHCKFNKYLCP